MSVPPNNLGIKEKKNPIATNEPKTVRMIYEASGSPEQLAKYYKCDLSVIYEILGFTGKTKKQVDRIHQEKNFYSHGYDNHLDFRIERYAQFLNEGDFEKFMPYAFMSNWNPKKIIMRLIVNLIPDSDSPIKHRRKNWIVMKFLKYQGVKWSKLENQNIELNKLL